MFLSDQKGKMQIYLNLDHIRFSSDSSCIDTCNSNALHLDTNYPSNSSVKVQSLEVVSLALRIHCFVHVFLSASTHSISEASHFLDLSLRCFWTSVQLLFRSVSQFENEYL